MSRVRRAVEPAAPRRGAAPAKAPGQGPATPVDLDAIRRGIVSCERCPRLRAWCERVAREKRAAFRDEAYWGRPVPGFGDARARLLVLGLAPAAHGANRTGRVFTGDGPGGSGDFLYRAMHDRGFASQPTSRHAGDGLTLSDAWVTAAVRCAPPGNKPSPEEVANCLPHLLAELEALRRVRVVVALGRIAADVAWRAMVARGEPASPRPVFAHGAVHHPADARTPVLVCSYHPSRQNTQTGRLTPRMLDEVFATARALLG